MQIFGGLEPVGLHERDELIALLDSERDPVELVAFLSRRFAPPVLCNTEGEPLVLCEVTLRTGDSDTLVAELDETYERDTDTVGARQWVEHLTDGMEPIRATLRLDGHDLTVHTNSEARLDRVLGVLRNLDPALTIVEESRQPVRDTRDAAALAASTPSEGAEPLDPAGPEVAAVLEKVVCDYERKWLDEPIPALAGCTPRQAAADPTRRDDLVRLIDSFPAHRDDPGLMNPTACAARSTCGSHAATTGTASSRMWAALSASPSAMWPSAITRRGSSCSAACEIWQACHELSELVVCQRFRRDIERVATEGAMCAVAACLVVGQLSLALRFEPRSGPVFVAMREIRAAAHCGPSTSPLSLPVGRRVCL